MTAESITIETIRGQETLPYLPDLVALRLSFFKNYPYLYDGKIADEENYVRIYARSKDSLLTIAKKGDEVIGILTGLPLLESSQDNGHLFNHEKLCAPHVFFIGELVLADADRKTNLEKQLYQEFEQAVKGLKTFTTLLVCEVDRQDSKKQVAQSSSVEQLWKESGFKEQRDFNVHYEWKEVDEQHKTSHRMYFWEKTL